MHQLEPHDFAMIETVLRGYPPSMARDDALAAMRRATVAVPHSDAWTEANVDRLIRQDGIWTAVKATDPTSQSAGHGYTAQEALDNLQSLLEGPQLVSQQRRDVALRDLGREMVRITTTVRGEDEWPAIPGLWLDCANERDRLRARLRSDPA